MKMDVLILLLINSNRKHGLRLKNKKAKAFLQENRQSQLGDVYRE